MAWITDWREPQLVVFFSIQDILCKASTFCIPDFHYFGFI